MTQDNRKRALAEVASLDAWHKGFTTSRKTADLHVDVVFVSGRIGEEPASNVRFKLRLKRAEVVVIIPPTEPASVDKASVSRDAPQVKLKATDTRTVKHKVSGGAKIKSKASPRSILPSLGADAAVSASRAHETAIKILEDVQAMRVIQVQNPDGDYAWVIEPATAATLEGRPWDANKKPRLKIKDTRLDRSKGIEPSIRSWTRNGGARGGLQRV